MAMLNNQRVIKKLGTLHALTAHVTFFLLGAILLGRAPLRPVGQADPFLRRGRSDAEQCAAARGLLVGSLPEARTKNAKRRIIPWRILTMNRGIGTIVTIVTWEP